MPSSPKKRPPGPVATATTPATLSPGNGLLPNRSTSPKGANAALSSALRPQTESLSARGGTMHNHTAFTPTSTASELNNLVAMDLSVPEPAVPTTPSIEINGERPSSSGSSSTMSASSSQGSGGAPLKRVKKSIDRGYDGDTVRERWTETSKALRKQGNGPRDYLTGNILIH